MSASPIAAAMLNPAFIATLLGSATERYESESGQPLPSAFAFLIAPLVLHRPTRDALPRAVSQHWAKWVLDNPVVIAGVPRRAEQLVGPVKDGLRFGLRHKVFALTEEGGLTGGLPAKAKVSSEGDLAPIVRKAGFVGRWLTRLDRPATAFAVLGVAP